MTENFFKGLNYTLGNEDTTVEVELVKYFRPKNILSICGSGGRSLPLAAFGCECLHLLDLSKEQILLAKLKEATYKQLTYDEFLLFWSYYPNPSNQNGEERKALFFKLSLDKEVFTFFNDVFESLQFHSLLYLGKWERTFAVLAKINRFLLGGNFDRIFTFTTIDEQKKFYHESFPHFRWRLVLFLLGNKALFNALLYKGDFIQKNLPLSHFQYYHSAFERLLTTDLASKSFFLHLCFYGKINSELGNPIEAGQEIYKGLVNSTSNIMYSAEDFLTHLKTGINRYDFLSLSDVPSYFSGGNEAQFMQMIRPGLNPGAIVVNRYYLRQPVCDLSGYLEITDDFKELLALEKVQMYVIKIYQFRP